MNTAQTKNYIPRETIDEIRSRTNIVEVVSECGVAMRPAGRDFKGLCPFHDEKTPSFTVSVQKQIFYCSVVKQAAMSSLLFKSKRVSPS